MLLFGWEFGRFNVATYGCGKINFFSIYSCALISLFIDSFYIGMSFFDFIKNTQSNQIIYIEFVLYKFCCLIIFTFLCVHVFVSLCVCSYFY